MGTARTMRRAADKRIKDARRLASRPERRAEPQRRADREAERRARHDDHVAWLESLTPEQRERYNRREDERVQRQMEICGPVLAMAASMAMRG